MEKALFSPTDEEILDPYARLKNLGGDTSHVDKVISTVDIYSLEPWELPRHSRWESKDQFWYFFCLKENKYNRGERQNRKTKSGFWKKTGETMDISRKRGGDREKIGEKRVLVFHFNDSKSKSDWVMHEYIATFLPSTQVTYTVCMVKFKGDASDLPSSDVITHMNNSGGSEGLQNPRHFTGLLDEETETQIDDAIRRAIFVNVSTPEFNSLLNYNDNVEEQEQWNAMFTQEDRNDYKPKPSLTGFISGDDDSDSDLVSATTTGSIQTSSNFDSFGSSNLCTDQITDLQNSPNSTTKLVPLTQVMSKTSLDASKEKYDDVQGTETGDYKMDQEAINNKRGSFFYMKIRSCIEKTLLCSSIPVKHD
ncbi:unnamed protein product [Eruca vesicaria subsp. sativa]|uniref:NAC domain-containing protein n=1 Tax=Eruca vesicaria subsp. sativa TaxID=29727 RepID=A0ABC8K7G7_ERUVS|nr:unnamed protein product [Eruca vesicaria subsp. sativa]